MRAVGLVHSKNRFAFPRVLRRGSGFDGVFAITLERLMEYPGSHIGIIALAIVGAAESCQPTRLIEQ